MNAIGHTDSVYADRAQQMLKDYGYTEARRICIRLRDSSSPGTISHAFHNATLKAIEAQREEESAQ